MLEGAIVAKNADEKALRFSNYILVLSLGALIILGCIDVVPSKRAFLSVLAYSCMVVVIASLGVSAFMLWKRLHRG